MCPQKQMSNKVTSKTWRWLRWFVGFAAIGATIGIGMIASWTDVSAVTASEASAVFAAQRAALGDSLPYIDLDEDGQSYLHHELERDLPQEIRAVHALVWLAVDQRLLQVRVPIWFVKAKDFNGNGLSLLLSTAEWSRADLSLNLSVEALERRGAGLLFDREREDGSKILLWSTSASDSAESPDKK
jgi:hypothetical protein